MPANPARTMPALLNNLKRKIDIVHVLIVLSFAVWVYMFRGFIFDKLALSGDALPYYDHFKFYIDHLMKGIYPMWNPIISGGIPNEFFLRRIGSFNPFYSIIMLFRWLGLPFVLSYLFFLAIYYWIGMTGFYLLSSRIFKDRICAFIAYLLLMFSSMSTVLFSSFLMLSVVPIIWFFYFLLSFSEKSERWSFVGMIFTLMIIVTTYLPFYFLHNFILFLICFIVFYPQYFLGFIKKSLAFLIHHKLFSASFLLCLCFALAAGLLFFKELATGEFLMPIRHKDTDALNALLVAPQTYIDGGIMATILVDDQFNYFDRFILGRFYVPIVFCVYILLGCIVRVNKKMMFLLSWAFLALVSGVYEASPVYKFLYDRVAYIKYMRNFQYFLWINLLPVLILLAVENLSLFLKEDWGRSHKRPFILWGLALAHAALIIYFMMNKATLGLSAAFGLSFLFFYFWIQKPECRKSKYIWFTLFMSILFHPIEVYSYLTKNSSPKMAPYDYERAVVQNFNLRVTREINSDNEYIPYLEENKINEILKTQQWPFTAWFSLKSYYHFRQMIAPEAVDLLSVFQLYDDVYRIDQGSPDYEFINKSLLKRANMAFISNVTPKSEFEMKNSLDAHPKLRRNILVSGNSEAIKAKTIQPNALELECNFIKNKFLVYTDNFEKQWEVFIDGKKEFLYQANLTFKGVWVPAGRHKVVFKYGAGFHGFYNKFLLFVFYAVFGALLVFLYRHCKLLFNPNFP